MRLDELAGEMTVDPEAARLFVQKWFDPVDLVLLTGFKVEGGAKAKRAQVVQARELVTAIDEESLSELVADEDGRWNVYFGVSPVKFKLSSPLKRGGTENVVKVPGVWADLDVKPGGFTSEAEILEVLWYSGRILRPSLVAATGSGGVHAYWKLDQPLQVADGEKLVKAWCAHLNEVAHASGAVVDRLTDASRIMRLPGSVRWPKKDEDLVAAPVRLLDTAGPVYSLADLWGVSWKAWERRVEYIKEVRHVERGRRPALDSVVNTDGLGKWAKMRLIAGVDEVFDELVTWDEILPDAGWTYLREDNQGRRLWARPGGGEKSATTDWPESPNMMSLLSSSEETGLADLKEAGIALDKYRVALRYWFDDDESAMINWVLERMKSNG